MAGVDRTAYTPPRSDLLSRDAGYAEGVCLAPEVCAEGGVAQVIWFQSSLPWVGDAHLLSWTVPSGQENQRLSRGGVGVQPPEVACSSAELQQNWAVPS